MMPAMLPTEAPKHMSPDPGVHAAGPPPGARREASMTVSRGGTRFVVIVSVLVAASIGLSAFLLFALELLVGRLVLPVFGGAPAAWATVLVFFQAILLVGYLYGHLVVSRLSVRAGALVHAVVVGAAVISLAVWPTHLATLRDPAFGPILDLLRVLALAVGIPSFVLTTTTPLLSSWYARIRCARDGDDPFWLYAVSNGASFAALVAYPLVAERLWGLATQRLLWEAAFLVLGMGLVLLAAIVGATRAGSRRADRRPGPAISLGGEIPEPPTGIDERALAGDREATDGTGDDVTARRRLAWVLVSAVPSALLGAVSNLVATDLVSAPLLWMGPLAIYLLSFVVAFSRRGRPMIPGALALTPIAVTLLWVPLGSVGLWPAPPLLGVAFAGYAVVATGLNGVLALGRPSVRHLTEFYLYVAVGGVLGGSFVGIVAPLLFPAIWEYPILLVATLAAVIWGAPAVRGEATYGPAGVAPARPAASATSPRRGLHFGPFFAGAPRRLIPYGIAAGLVLLAIVPLGGVAVEAVARWLAVGALIILVGGIPRFFVVATAVLLIVVTFVIPGPALFQGRSFFGVSRVVVRDGAARVLLNGTTVHGLQAADPVLRREPTAYYVRSGPAGDLFAVSRGTEGDRRLDVGIAGLGNGGLATYARSGDAFTFYEIDPVVIRVASDPSLFTFLSDALAPPRIVEGDARLSLVSVPDATHDLLLVDAFSSDTPPAHLLTVEAIADAMRTVKQGGILALHLSNRYHGLAPAAVGAAEHLGLSALQRDYDPAPEDRARLFATPSEWVAIARSPADLAGLTSRGWVVPATTEPVTDDRPDILRLLRPLW